MLGTPGVRGVLVLAACCIHTPHCVLSFFRQATALGTLQHPDIGVGAGRRPVIALVARSSRFNVFEFSFGSHVF